MADVALVCGGGALGAAVVRAILAGGDQLVAAGLDLARFDNEFAGHAYADRVREDFMSVVAAA
jgi:hypothetical protein